MYTLKNWNLQMVIVGPGELNSLLLIRKNITENSLLERKQNLIIV